jgi:PST family polysaccharide transporter
MQRQVAYFALPLIAVVTALAPEIEQLFGDEWQGTATAIRLLAAVQAIKALVTLMGPALQAKGRPGAHSVVLWIFTALGGVALAIAATAPMESRGIVAICLAVLAANATTAILMAHVSSRILGFTWPQLVRSWIPGLIVGATAFGAATAARGLVGDLPTFAVVAVSGGSALVAAAAALLIGDRTARAALLQLRPRRASPVSRRSDTSRS